MNRTACVEVLSTLALRGVIDDIAAAFLGRTSLTITAKYMSTNAALGLLAQDTGADMAILIREATETLIQQGVILNGSVADIAQSGIGVAVRAGTKKPDISTATAFRNAMLEAKSVAFSRLGASGLHFAEVIERLGIAAEVRRHAKVGDAYAGELAARGEAEIAVQQMSELVPVGGIDIVGPFPDELQKITVFSAGILTSAANPDGARQLIAYLASPAQTPLMQRLGLEPALRAE